MTALDEFPYVMRWPRARDMAACFAWLDEINLAHGTDYITDRENGCLIRMADGYLGLAFKDKNAAMMYKLRWHQP